jgi:hypothetical protein
MKSGRCLLNGGLFEGRGVLSHTAYGYSCCLRLLEPILKENTYLIDIEVIESYAHLQHQK